MNSRLGGCSSGRRTWRSCGAVLAGEGAGSPATNAGGGRGGSDGGGRGWSRRMMGMVLSASTTVLADSTIRLLTANPTAASVRTTASIRSRRPRFACCVNRACAREFCCKILFFKLSRARRRVVERDEAPHNAHPASRRGGDRRGGGGRRSRRSASTSAPPIPASESTGRARWRSSPTSRGTE